MDETQALMWGSRDPSSTLVPKNLLRMRPSSWPQESVQKEASGGWKDFVT